MATEKDVRYLAQRTGLLSPRFAVIAAIGSLSIIFASIAGPLEVAIALLGVYVSVLAGYFAVYVERDHTRRVAKLLERVEVPLGLAPEHELFDEYCNFAGGLIDLAKQPDPVLREFARLKLASVTGEVQALAQGTVVFSSTETWRTVYQRLLESLTVQTYYSVAWVKTDDYWQDQPGRHSMELNFSLASRGFRVERVLIIRDYLWPDPQPSPLPEIQPWIAEQHDRGIVVSAVRESELESEPDLIRDFGIYGDQAVGEQDLDERCRTQRFILRFDRQARQVALERWDRLSLYAIPFADLLDPPT